MGRSVEGGASHNEIEAAAEENLLLFRGGSAGCCAGHYCRAGPRLHGSTSLPTHACELPSYSKIWALCALPSPRSPLLWWGGERLTTVPFTPSSLAGLEGALGWHGNPTACWCSSATFSRCTANACSISFDITFERLAGNASDQHQFGKSWLVYSCCYHLLQLLAKDYLCTNLAQACHYFLGVTM